MRLYKYFLDLKSQHRPFPGAQAGLQCPDHLPQPSNTLLFLSFSQTDEDSRQQAGRLFALHLSTQQGARAKSFADFWSNSSFAQVEPLQKILLASSTSFFEYPFGPRNNTHVSDILRLIVLMVSWCKLPMSSVFVLLRSLVSTSHALRTHNHFYIQRCPQNVCPQSHPPCKGQFRGFSRDVLQLDPRFGSIRRERGKSQIC